MSGVATRAWTGRTFLFWLLGFFAIVFAANIVFVWFAADSWTGLAAEESYRRGVDYNQVLDRAARQDALGWTVQVGFQQTGDNTGDLTLQVVDSNGTAIEGRAVSASLRRPVIEGFDFAATLRMSAPGLYATQVVLPSPGQWDVRFEISQSQAQPYLVETRIWSK